MITSETAMEGRLSYPFGSRFRSASRSEKGALEDTMRMFQHRYTHRPKIQNSAMGPATRQPQRAEQQTCRLKPLPIIVQASQRDEVHVANT